MNKTNILLHLFKNKISKFHYKSYKADMKYVIHIIHNMILILICVSYNSLMVNLKIPNRIQPLILQVSVYF